MTQQETNEPTLTVSESFEEAPSNTALAPVVSTVNIVNTRTQDLGEEVWREGAMRRRIGWVLGGIGIVVVIVAIIVALCAINNNPSIPSMVAHAVISLGAVWFGYQMLRAAERMFVPQRLLRGGDSKTDVELVRALTGINAPTSAALEQSMKMAGEFVRSVADATKEIKR